MFQRGTLENLQEIDKEREKKKIWEKMFGHVAKASRGSWLWDGSSSPSPSSSGVGGREKLIEVVRRRQNHLQSGPFNLLCFTLEVSQ